MQMITSFNNGKLRIRFFTIATPPDGQEPLEQRIANLANAATEVAVRSLHEVFPDVLRVHRGFWDTSQQEQIGGVLVGGDLEVSQTLCVIGDQSCCSWSCAGERGAEVRAQVVCTGLTLARQARRGISSENMTRLKSALADHFRRWNMRVIVMSTPDAFIPGPLAVIHVDTRRWAGAEAPALPLRVAPKEVCDRPVEDPQRFFIVGPVVRHVEPMQIVVCP